MQKMNAQELVDKFYAGKCTPEEIALLESWYLKWNAEKPAGLTDEQLSATGSEMWKEIAQSQSRQIKLTMIRRITAAAAILVVLGAGLFFYQYNDDRNASTPKLSKGQDVAPGGNKAILTLADGRSINLSDAANGDLAKQSGISITKAADGKLIYTASAGSGLKDNGEPILNTITTPVGGQYQINLPDGTKVWLNAASSIKFPAKFTNLKERRVEITGEAYFEVAHNKKQPFTVSTGKQELYVLGTHFNVNSYVDEGAIKTTLLEGMVLVRNVKAKDPQEGKDFVILKPGQQSSLTERMTVEATDLEMVTAWKDGNFMFNDLDLKSILKQISRWYNVGVDYSRVPEHRSFTGFISRNVNLSKVLEMLEVTGRIKFTIEDKTIKVMELKTAPM